MPLPQKEGSMSIAAILNELENETATTRRVLERVPSDKLTWKPHPKSMSLGELALHVAMSPGYIAENWACKESIDFGKGGGKPPEPTSTQDILAAHDESVKKTRTALNQIGDDGLRQQWTATMNGATVFNMPKAALVRSIVLNHCYHHRGQLSVYLRLLDVPVPSIYGPSADESPFQAQA
jgi:uncharacterized damage-inducible protein DinB